MRTRERNAVLLLIALMLLVWLGFLVHRSPRFAGSALGGLLAVVGTLLMLVPLAYQIVKRVPGLKRRVTAKISMANLLSIHIYAGLVGAILVLLHTGHKFDSPLGMALVAMVLVVVMSGFVGRYLLNSLGQGLRAKNRQLAQLRERFPERRVVASEPKQRGTSAGTRPSTPPQTTVLSLENDAAAVALLEPQAARTHQPATTPEVAAAAGAMADLEYAVAVHARFETWFGHWLRFHRLISAVMYVLLAAHVASAIYFGLRWFP